MAVLDVAASVEAVLAAVEVVSEIGIADLLDDSVEDLAGAVVVEVEDEVRRGIAVTGLLLQVGIINVGLGGWCSVHAADSAPHFPLTIYFISFTYLRCSFYFAPIDFAVRFA